MIGPRLEIKMMKCTRLESFRNVIPSQRLQERAIRRNCQSVTELGSYAGSNPRFNVPIGLKSILFGGMRHELQGWAGASKGAPHKRTKILALSAPPEAKLLFSSHI